MNDVRITRTELYDLVWSEPINTLAEKFGYSDVGLSKLCKRLEIPLPTRGHWARVQAGQKLPKPILPARRAAHERLVLRLLSDSEREARRIHREREAIWHQSAQDTLGPTDSAKLHPLAKAARDRLKQPDSWGDQTLRSAPKEVLDIEVTRDSVDRAASLASSILACLEQSGARVAIDVQKGRTILERLDTQLPFKISEHVARSDHEMTRAERRAMDRYINGINSGYSAEYPSIPRHDYTPTGQLTITVSGWPQRNWRDTKRTQLEQRLGAIVAGIVSLAEELRDRERERERKRQEHAARMQHYESEMDRKDQERRHYRTLRLQAKRWKAANEIREYVRFVKATGHTPPATTPHNLAGWIEWALGKAAWLDPTVLASDILLDAPDPEKPCPWY